MKREFLQNLKIGDQALTKEVIDLSGKDIEAAKKPFADTVRKSMRFVSQPG